MDMGGALFIAAVVMAFIIDLVVSPGIKRRKLRRKLLTEFGKGFTRQRIEQDEMEDIGYYHKEKLRAHPSSSAVDDTTWSDLSMDELFMGMNRTVSNVGEQLLYDVLRTCDENEAVVKRRYALGKWFSENAEARVRIQLGLHAMRKDRFHGAALYLFRPEVKKPEHYFMYVALALVPFGFLIGAIWMPGLLLVYAMLFVLNMMVYYKASRKWHSEIRAVAHLTAAVRCAKKLSRMDVVELEPEIAELRRLMPELRGMMGWTQFFNMQEQGALDFVTVYIKIMLHTDMISLGRILGQIERHSQVLNRVYEIVGEIDAVIAVASLREAAGEGRIVEPEFWGEKVVEACDVAHPLVKEPVLNSIRWERNVLITGSNASGKSTFTKAIALNVILAQSLGMVYAKGMKLPRVRVMSSMAIRDDVEKGDSYFIAEIRSLKRILDAIDDEVLTLCFIDEILRGTNTVERIAASGELLRYLGKENALVMAATHDIELTEILSDCYENKHFREEMTDTGMVFPYKLMEGPSETRNAILLLGMMGFPKEVVEAAEQRANERQAHA